MIKGSFEFDVLVNGSSVKEYLKDGSTYIQANPGSRFSIRMKNNSSDRVLFVPTVDGLSILNGEDGSYRSNGYVIRPWSSTTIDGWRRSDKEVAEFYFTNPRDSYRKRSGKGDNLGAIGCAIFKEKVRTPAVEEVTFKKIKIIEEWAQKEPYMFSGHLGMQANNVSMRADFGPRKGSVLRESNAALSNVAQDVGTGWGETKKSEVVTVDFIREDSPSEVFTLYYNTRARLDELGVGLKEPLYVTREAFPGEWCKPPKN